MNDTSQVSKWPITTQAVWMVLIGIVVGLLLSFTAFYLVRAGGNSNESIVDEPPPINSPQLTSHNYGPNFNSDLNTLVSYGSSVSEMRRLGKFLGTLDKERLLDLVTASSTETIADRQHAVQQMLFEYLVQLSPIEAIESVWMFGEPRRNELLKIVFINWSARDLEPALSEAMRLEPPYRGLALTAILESVDDLSDEELAKFATLKQDVERVKLLRKQETVVLELMEQSPKDALDLLAKDDIEDFEQAVLFRLAVDRLFQSEGLDVVLRLHNLNVGSGLKEELFVEIADRDRLGTLLKIQDIPFHEQISLVSPLMVSWVEQNADAALETVLELPESYFRKSIYRTLLYRWAQYDPLHVLDRISEFPRDLRSGAVTSAYQALVLTDPSEALRRLPLIRSVPGATDTHTEVNFVQSWSRVAPEDAVEWAQSNVEEDSLARARMLWWALPELALSDPEKAMRIAASEKPHPFYGTVGLDHMIIEKLVNADRLDDAIELLDQVREEARSLAYADVGEKFVREDRFDDAVILSERVPVEDRLSYFYSLTSRLSFNNASDVIELVASVTDDGLRSDIVNLLLSNNWSIERYYTEEQIDTLRSLVAE